MKNGENYNNSRRTFFKSIAASLLIIPFLDACKEKAITLLIRLSGTNHILGHQLRVQNFPKPTKEISIPYLIVGGGISGLSAARQLTKKGITDFLIVELEDHLGGNSSNGENKYSKYPLGAHYLPLPNLEDKELLQFLTEEKIILGYDANGLPQFDETQLTFAPDERLFYKNIWQEGLVPKQGNSVVEDEELNRFFKLMADFRIKKDPDGKFWFMIPLSQSATNEMVKALDSVTMQQWFVSNNFTSKPLFDYIDYCCKDDFGLGIDYVSAYAGIHYFAGRKQNSSPNKGDTVLTWPEGNARLAQHLQKYVVGKSLKNHLVYNIKIDGNKAVATVFDNKTKTSTTITADKIVLATPQFVNQYLLENRKNLAKQFHYTPWMLATIVVSDLVDNNSFPLCWDNVIYGSKGLGYVYDQHQSLQQIQDKKVITYYYSFSSSDLKKTRRYLYKKPKEHWKQVVFNDLKIAHPTIEEDTESIEIHLLGHGMVSPVPGFIYGQAKKEAAKPIDNKIYFAHTDLAGISVFEEAFHQGINAVNQMIDGTTMDS
ncbi:twin-arginine translocation pathway signal protein [Flavobacterium faecale]|uniref:Twin-arginine translocation pathway signal protein n=1 Tax=Flavobacterium faecale TaxID=1355330 RepID=A0A2S1LBD0_9FLAO|nr:FAD-dependent oxidoreductase [Flavobacterium faecale]AWG20866.1 twin-arginine translocation pathway signal protein [Flavobacterium faecale]